MICPYCDSLVRDVPDNRCCPNCGGPLGEPEKPKYPEPPLGIYKQTFGFMETQAQGVRFYAKFLGNITDRYIPYEELCTVCIVPGGKELGYLSVRGKSNIDLPLASSVREAAADATSVIFTTSKNAQYQKAYDFFKAVCECNKLR